MPESRYYGYLRVFYPLQRGRLTLRTERDWEHDLEPSHVSEDGQRFDFLLEHERPYLFCKPCIRDGEQIHWSEGANKLLVLSETPQDCYPHFFSGERGVISEVLHIPSQTLAGPMQVRLYQPAGYTENHLKRYPVLYMHDGRNLFFPQEAFLGQEWQVDENMDLLDSMSLIDRFIVVGIFAADRNAEYTQPGYERYGQALVEDLKPWVDRERRTLADPVHTAAMGSSLGGVVSLFLGWQYPQVFGNVACLSSTFGYRDDLLERVRSEAVESRRGLRVYLDSGWPHDNYEVTVSMAFALIQRGFTLGQDLMHLAFPKAAHNEASWGARVHIPLQLFSGKARRAAERYAGQPTSTSRSTARRHPPKSDPAS